MYVEVNEAELENLFTYHAPRPDQVPKYDDLRQAGKAFAESILRNCPPSADRSAAMRKVREAVMTANAAIACAPTVKITETRVTTP